MDPSDQKSYRETCHFLSSDFFAYGVQISSFTQISIVQWKFEEDTLLFTRNATFPINIEHVSSVCLDGSAIFIVASNIGNALLPAYRFFRNDLSGENKEIYLKPTFPQWMSKMEVDDRNLYIQTNHEIHLYQNKDPWSYTHRVDVNHTLQYRRYKLMVCTSLLDDIFCLVHFGVRKNPFIPCTQIEIYQKNKSYTRVRDWTLSDPLQRCQTATVQDGFLYILYSDKMLLYSLYSNDQMDCIQTVPLEGEGCYIQAPFWIANRLFVLSGTSNGPLDRLYVFS